MRDTASPERAEYAYAALSGLAFASPTKPQGVALGCPIVPFQGKEENPHAEDVARLRNVDHPRQNCHTPGATCPSFAGEPHGSATWRGEQASFDGDGVRANEQSVAWGMKDVEPC